MLKVVVPLLLFLRSLSSRFWKKLLEVGSWKGVQKEGKLRAVGRANRFIGSERSGRFARRRQLFYHVRLIVHMPVHFCYIIICGNNEVWQAFTVLFGM